MKQYLLSTHKAHKKALAYLKTAKEVPAQFLVGKKDAASTPKASL
jgi:hypothetical protein